MIKYPEVKIQDKDDSDDESLDKQNDTAPVLQEQEAGRERQPTTATNMFSRSDNNGCLYDEYGSLHGQIR